MTNTSLILIIEDNPDILRANTAELRLAGYRVLEADTLEKGRILAQEEHPDLVLLDIILPDGNGIAYSKELFGQHMPRILFLSVLNTKEDVIAGLRAGGDDYMTKPYLMEELILRVDALLRRANYKKEEKYFLRIGELKLNRTSRKAYYKDNDLMLTPKEFILLEILLKNQGQYINSCLLYEKVWGMQAIDTRPVKQHIRKIRNKLEKNSPFIIEASQGKGYRLISKQNDLRGTKI